MAKIDDLRKRYNASAPLKAEPAPEPPEPDVVPGFEPTTQQGYTLADAKDMEPWSINRTTRNNRPFLVGFSVKDGQPTYTRTSPVVEILLVDGPSVTIRTQSGSMYRLVERHAYDEDQQVLLVELIAELKK